MSLKAPCFLAKRNRYGRWNCHAVRGNATGSCRPRAGGALVSDRHLRMPGLDKIAMQRMRQPVFHRAGGRQDRSPDHLAAEHPLPAPVWAIAPQQVHLDRLEVEDCAHVDQALDIDELSACSVVIQGHRHSAVGSFKLFHTRSRSLVRLRSAIEWSGASRRNQPISSAYGTVWRILLPMCDIAARGVPRRRGAVHLACSSLLPAGVAPAPIRIALAFVLRNVHVRSWPT